MKNTDVNLSEIFVVVILHLGACVLRALSSIILFEIKVRFEFFSNFLHQYRYNNLRHCSVAYHLN